jgi:mgtE-like transporter
MPRLTKRYRAHLVNLLRAESADVRQGFAALLVSSFGDLVAGVTLGVITGTLEELPGLLVLVPAAIGMRGNIFGALGSRLGTAIHTGQFSLARRRDTIVGQNLVAALLLSVSISFVLGILAKAIAVAFAVPNSISILDFVVISVIGGILSSVVVAAITIAVAALAVRREWDLDNVAAPVVTAAGDMVTLPSLFVASLLVGYHLVTPVIGALCILAGLAALAAGIRAGLPLVRRIIIESTPVLVVAGTVDVIAGITIEKRLEGFLAFPALLVLIPPFLEDSGALGSILSARLGTKLHLGVLEPANLRLRALADDIVVIYLYAVPVFLLVGVASDVTALVTDLASPGSLEMIGIALLAGFMATTGAVAVAISATVVSYRMGLDPDTYGVPIVTSSLDLIGAIALILAIVMLGVT